MSNFFKNFYFYILLFVLEILWDELMSDYSYIGHLLSSMVDRLAEVISNGGGMAHQFNIDSVHNYSVRKTWFFFKASPKQDFSLSAGFLFMFI